jgi:hypothetical protein
MKCCIKCCLSNGETNFCQREVVVHAVMVGDKGSKFGEFHPVLQELANG